MATPDNPTTPQQQTFRKAKIYEVVEFASLGPNDKMVSVGRYRTIYLPNGSIRRMHHPAKDLLKELVSCLGGYTLENESNLTAFFKNPEAAAECARAVAELHKRQVQLEENQVIISL